MLSSLSSFLPSDQSHISIFKSAKKSLIKVAEGLKANSSFKEHSPNSLGKANSSFKDHSPNHLGNMVTFVDDKTVFNLESPELKEVNFPK